MTITASPPAQAAVLSCDPTGVGRSNEPVPAVPRAVAGHHQALAGRSRSDAAAVAACAMHALHLEIRTWPKPGLVSHLDPGSHRDMDAGTFHRSATAIAPFLARLAEAGQRGCVMEELRAVGLAAETAMLRATGGINTHRGAIFGMGLLCAAAGARATGRVDPDMTLGAVVAHLWGSAIITGPMLLHSHGQIARRRYGAGGARLEASRGFPSVYRVGLPMLRHGEELAPGDPEAARVQACFALIATLEDTNLLHRGGAQGLRFARKAAKAFLERGGVGQPEWRAHAEAVHRAFVARDLSPGGSADLLAMALFVAALDGESVEHGAERHS